VESNSRQPYLTGRVEDVMVKEPLTVSEDDSIYDLVGLFLSHHYHGFPVVNAGGKLVGTVRDVEVIAMFATRDPFVGEYRKVRDIMHTPPFVISPSDTVQKAAIKMFKDGTRFLVVTGEGGSVLGVVTRIDLIRGIKFRD
jgi:CBS domain-containing protein